MQCPRSTIPPVGVHENAWWISCPFSLIRPVSLLPTTWPCVVDVAGLACQASECAEAHHPARRRPEKGVGDACRGRIAGADDLIAVVDSNRIAVQASQGAEVHHPTRRRPPERMPGAIARYEARADDRTAGIQSLVLWQSRVPDGPTRGNCPASLWVPPNVPRSIAVCCTTVLKEQLLTTSGIGSPNTSLVHAVPSVNVLIDERAVGPVAHLHRAGKRAEPAFRRAERPVRRGRRDSGWRTVSACPGPDRRTPRWYTRCRRSASGRHMRRSRRSAPPSCR